MKILLEKTTAVTEGFGSKWEYSSELVDVDLDERLEEWLDIVAPLARDVWKRCCDNPLSFTEYLKEQLEVKP